MPAERRVRLTPDERRAQLIAAGVGYLADHALDDLTIDVLAGLTGVSRALVFHYFDTRQGMHRAVVQAARDALLTATLPQPELPPRERVHDVLLRITQFVDDHRGTFFSLVRGIASGDPSVRAVVDQAREANAEHLRESLVELGERDTAALRLALRSWVAFTEETLIALAAERSGARATDATIVAFLERTLEGVVAAAREASF
ncbi:TetR/AcrR family transcriptional regulator [Microbacterium sp. ARD32]|uniref:TetR/AcrR family transcriptional regulator n=1 Tax=Microbacterium sp. ARD32 TaxID=2962577 RepID=UPI002882791F|nr:TetR/AcrR family transcriptional regulator [Microbacterium sp. ARD32]MDT0157523.1 TetR/AcrR family transcriptional regulator [Microbacterium sp. ARD32]